MEADGTLTHAQRRSGIIRPLRITALATVLLLAVIGTVLTTRYDSASREREQRMVSHGFGQHITEYASVVVPQIDWDDAVDKIDNHFDPAWIDRNITTYLHVMNGITRVFIINDDNEQLSYAAIDGHRAGPQAFKPFADPVRMLMPAIRAAEAARPPLHTDPGSARLVASPIQRSGIAMVGGQPFIVVASLVQPDFGTTLPNDSRAPVVITALPLDAAMLARFASRYQVEGLHISVTPPPAHGFARIQLRDPRGRPAAWLVWEDRTPGVSLMLNLAGPLSIMLLVLTLISMMFFRRSEAIASDLIASEARARHLAFHDTLTQLPNRAMMFDRLRLALASARRNNTTLAVHCLDLDRFKGVNDTLGHQAGDELIRRVAQILTDLCRETDTVARLGGDEFVIIQPDTGATGAALLAERVLRAIKDPIDLEYGVVEVGISIGATLIENGAIDPGEAIRQADLALYDAKEKGRNRLAFFEPEMDAAVRMRRALETDLRRALTDGSLQMVYQTQVDHRGNVNGLEALIRWHHPERGPIAPAVFIPLAEESGLILDIGEFVFRRVFEETIGWNKRVAVNVSALQLRSPTFMAMLTQLVAEFRIDASHYEIEITETALLGDDGVTRNNIIMLKQEGFTIALDDFGTGYSSLSTLQRFEVDKIKIDRSFIRNLNADEEADALIDAIIQLGRALKLNIVAEGVETESQRDRLMSSGCHMFQGYLVSRPVSAHEASLLAA